MKIGDSVAFKLVSWEKVHVWALWEKTTTGPATCMIHAIHKRIGSYFWIFIFVFSFFFPLRTEPSSILWTCSWRVRLSCLWDVIIFNDPCFFSLFICEPHIVHLLPYVCVSCAHTCNYRDSVCVDIISYVHAVCLGQNAQKRTEQHRSTKMLYVESQMALTSQTRLTRVFPAPRSNTAPLT